MSDEKSNPKSMPSDIESSIGAYAEDFSLENVPSPIKERARLVLLDTIGVSIRGSTTDYVKRAIESGVEMDFWDRSGRSTAFSTRDWRSPLVAAFANASGATTLELDEGNQQSAHIGVHVVPPALAVAEATNASGTDLLRAIIVSYEVSARLGDLNRPLTGNLHPHGAWAPVGAAVAAGSLYGFDSDRYVEAIRLSTNPFVATHWAAATEGATVRNFYSGTSCLHGLIAAMLASSGVTGMAESISRSLLSHTARDEVPAASIEERFSTLGDEYYLKSSYFKIHAACRYTHPPIEAIERIDRLESANLDEIDRISITTFEDATMLDGKRPHNTLSAKFSIPYAVAARIVLDTSDFNAYHGKHLENNQIRQLARRVDIAQGERFEQAKREHSDWGAAVEVRFADGTTADATVTNARGGGENPFSRDTVIAKFERLVGSVESDETAASLRARLLSIQQTNDVRELLTDLRGADPHVPSES